MRNTLFSDAFSNFPADKAPYDDIFTDRANVLRQQFFDGDCFITDIQLPEQADFIFILF
jgi:hypothetical protein